MRRPLTTLASEPDLAASRSWYTYVPGIDPYFDQEFYVGFNVGGYELGLDPQADPAAEGVTYWAVLVRLHHGS